MKKFIDRMEAAQSPGEASPSSGSANTDAKGKKKWGLGGMVRRVTGGPGSGEKEKEKEVKKESSDGSAEEAAGLQVDFYLVIVS
jgi:ubiquitin-like-conjugating enzyme ATG3